MAAPCPSAATNTVGDGPFRVHNFNAGPAGLPLEVMEAAAAEFTNYRGSGMGVLEMSHRSALFEDIIARAERRIRDLLDVPADYAVLFMQGGGTTQFSAVPLNLLGKRTSAAYLVTGAWSQAAADEARRFVDTVHIVHSTAPAFDSFPAPDQLSVPSDCAYLHYCHNETVHGVEAPCVPRTSVPLVADCSSSFLSAPLDVSAHALIYAGAQKNVGPAGVTLVIVRRALLSATAAHPLTPLMLNYATQASKQSMYNTPPTFAVYLVGLVLDWIERQGGIRAMAERSAQKSALLYAALDGSDGFYAPCVQGQCRSRMNVVFRVRERSLEASLIAEAESSGLVGLAGHRSVGGLRASLYNAVTLDDVRVLVDFLQRFADRHRP